MNALKGLKVGEHRECVIKRDEDVLLSTDVTVVNITEDSIVCKQNINPNKVIVFSHSGICKQDLGWLQ